jgi:hypothetical protein
LALRPLDYAGLVTLAIITFVGTRSALAQERAGSGSAHCDQDPIHAIPHRTADAPAGSEFARRIQSLSGPQRDAEVRSEVLSGNVPQFLRHLAPVTVRNADSAHPVEITVCVLPDYLAVGSDKDFVYVPLGLEAALDIAEQFGFDLPTPKLVDAIYYVNSEKRSIDDVLAEPQLATLLTSEGPLTRIAERLSVLMAQMARDRAVATVSGLQPDPDDSARR